MILATPRYEREYEEVEWKDPDKQPPKEPTVEIKKSRGMNLNQA